MNGLDSVWKLAAAVAVMTAGVLRPATASEPALPEVAWKPIFQGVDLAELAVGGDEPQRGAAVRIDLKAQGIRVITTPSNGDREGETDAQRTTTFLRRSGCQIAINGAPFSPIQSAEDTPQDISGLHVSEGVVVSKAHWAPSLAVSRDNVASIVRRSRDPLEYWNAIAGFGIVLSDGQVAGRGKPDQHPRTGAGVSKDGRILYLLVIDGRQRGYSIGVTEEVLGAWLRHLGADDGINLDGGGTTTLVIAQPDGGPKIVNRPIHAGIPGLERIAGSHLGVFALPLPGPRPADDVGGGDASEQGTDPAAQPSSDASSSASPKTVADFLRRVFGG